MAAAAFGEPAVMEAAREQDEQKRAATVAITRKNVLEFIVFLVDLFCALGEFEIES